MKLTSSQKQLLKDITKHPGWAIVEQILREEMAELLDINNIKGDITSEVYGRKASVETLRIFLKKIGMLTSEPINIKPEKYI